MLLSDFMLNRQELQKKVRHTVHQLLWEKGYVSPLDLLGEKRPLRFSKSGDSQVERHYATHYVKSRLPEQTKLNPAAVKDNTAVKNNNVVKDNPLQGSDEA